MTTTPSFVEWLRAQAKSDPDREQAFAGLYEHGPYLASSLGTKPPDPAAFKAYLSLLDPPLPEAVQEDLLRQLVIADATWRTDTMDDIPADPPYAGTDVVLPPPKPIKPVICGYRGLDGVQCRDEAVPGAARCAAHGGAITDAGVRASLLLLAYAQMAQGTKKAVETLIDVMETSTNDLARVNAAKEMLDRAGLSVDQHHTVTHQTAGEAVDTREDALNRIRRHLDSTRARLLPPSDDDIVDAEILETPTSTGVA